MMAMTPIKSETLSSCEERLQDVSLRLRALRKKLADSPIDEFRGEIRSFRGAIDRLEDFALKLEYRCELAVSVANKKQEFGED